MAGQPCGRTASAAPGLFPVPRAIAGRATRSSFLSRQLSSITYAAAFVPCPKVLFLPCRTSTAQHGQEKKSRIRHLPSLTFSSSGRSFTHRFGATLPVQCLQDPMPQREIQRKHMSLAPAGNGRTHSCLPTHTRPRQARAALPGRKPSRKSCQMMESKSHIPSSPRTISKPSFASIPVHTRPVSSPHPP